jgi:hypothetical protein
MVDRKSNKSPSIKETLPLKINLSEMIEVLNKSGKYSDDNIELEFYKKDKVNESTDNNDSKQMYGRIAKEKFQYIGVLNESLERDLFGINVYKNSDIYIGHYQRGIKSGKGFYMFSPKPSTTSTKKIVYEFYNGSFQEDKKNGLGSYVWIEEKEGDNSLDNCKMDSFIGTFENDKRNRGLYLEKIDDVFCAYYGNFKDGLKHDSKALIYDNENDRVFRARYENGKPVSGYVVTFTEEDQIANVSYVTYDTESNIKAIAIEKFIEKTTLEKITLECKTYRKILFEEKCFENCYENAKILINASKKFTRLSFERFNNTTGYDEIVEFLNNKTEQEAFKSLYKKIG